MISIRMGFLSPALCVSVLFSAAQFMNVSQLHSRFFAPSVSAVCMSQDAFDYFSVHAGKKRFDKLLETPTKRFFAQIT